MKSIWKAGLLLLLMTLLAGCGSSERKIYTESTQGASETESTQMSAASASAQDEAGEKLVVGVRKNLYRMSYYYEDSDQFYGFEDDLALELAQRLGYEGVEYVGLDIEDRDRVLDEGSVDCIIAAYSRTEERESKYHLTAPYYEDYGRILIQKSTLFTSWRDLKGKKVGYCKGTDAMDAFAKKLVEDGYIDDVKDVKTYCKVYELKSYDRLMHDIEVGTIDAACLDGCIALGFMDEDMMYLTKEYYSRESYCIASPQNSSLSDAIDQALTEMLEDGTVDALAYKWDLDDGLTESKSGEE